MKIADLYKSSNKPVFSFEFFPPKSPEGEKKLMENAKELKTLSPGFVSVTYGAGGSTREKTIDIAENLQNQLGFTSMCHFTCVGSTSDQVRDTLKIIEAKKITNVIALRGDPPKGEGKFVKTPGGFGNATELIQFIKKEKFSFCLAGGCYPEKHPDSLTEEDDIYYLKEKTKAGAEFLITQLFFHNPSFEKFLERVRKSGITVPVIPGIMPITSFSQIEKFQSMAYCSIPQSLIQELDQVKDDRDLFLKKSLEFTVNQCKELLNMGVAGLHFFTLNQSRATIEIMKSLM